MTAQFTIAVKDQGVQDLARYGHAKARKGMAAGIRWSLEAVEKHHKANEWVRRSAGGGLRLSGGHATQQPAVADKITNRTGNLSRSYTFAKLDSAGLIGSYGSASKIAAYLEEGTRAHRILPRNKKALAFVTGASFTRTGRFKSDVKGVFAGVNHPGTRPRPTMERTSNNRYLGGKIEEIMADAVIRQGIDAK